MKNRNRNISSFLIRNFILFSFIVLAVFTIANFFINIMGDKYLLAEAEKYFADTLLNENYENIDVEYVESLSGWVSILDSELYVVYSTNDDELNRYTNKQLVELSKGEMDKGGENIYASMTYFTDKSGKERLGLVCIPAENIKVTATITNMKMGIESLILIYVGGILVFAAGYVLTVLGLSWYMKKKLTNPIYALKRAFSEVSAGDYTVNLDFNAVTEFLEIRDSFNKMVRTLHDMEEEKNNVHCQRQQLFSDLGHDLKTPTTIIQGYSGAILEGKAKGEGQTRRYIEMIHESAINLGELIELLLDYTRFDRMDYQLKLTDTDLGEYLRQIIIEKMPLFEEAGMNLFVEIPEERIEVEIDLKILKRAIVNLLNNILQHNPFGIDVLVQLIDGADKQIIIADRGRKIPEEMKEQIFEPFVCGDESRNSTRHNSGLGLSITRKIVERHNGKIYLEQEWGAYTKAFIIILP